MKTNKKQKIIHSVDEYADYIIGVVEAKETAQAEKFEFENSYVFAPYERRYREMRKSSGWEEDAQ